MGKKKSHIPQECIVYVCDYENDGRPILAVAASVDDLPDDGAADETVGVFVLNRRATYKVSKSLK